MCMGGGGAKAPKIKEQPQPFQDRSYQDSMAAFQKQSQEQAAAMQQQVAAQIAGIQAQTQQMQAQFESDLAAQQAAQAAADAQGAYTTVTKEGELSEDAQTTESIASKKEEKKAKSTLKIGGGVKVAKGTGLNIGM